MHSPRRVAFLWTRSKDERGKIEEKASQSNESIFELFLKKGIMEKSFEKVMGNMAVETLKNEKNLKRNALKDEVLADFNLH